MANYQLPKVFLFLVRQVWQGIRKYCLWDNIFFLMKNFLYISVNLVLIEQVKLIILLRVAGQFD